MKSDYTPRYAAETASGRGWVWYLAGAVIFLPLFYAFGYYLIGPVLMGRSNQPELGSLSVVRSMNAPAPEQTIPENSVNTAASAQPEPEVVITEEHPNKTQKVVPPPAASVPREVIVFPDRPARQAFPLKRKMRRIPARTERTAISPERRFGAKTQESANPAETEKQQPRAASTAPEQMPSKLYRVQVGVYTDKTTAKGVADDLSAKGYAPYVGPSVKGDKSRYKVQVGAFRDKAHADKVANDLKEKGYEIYIAPEE